MDARSEFAQNAIAETLADAGNWRDLSRSQYNSFFNDRGYDRQSNHLTRQLSRLKELRSESTNPQLTKTVDAYIEFLEHINQSISPNRETRQAQSAEALELLAKARIEASTLDDSYTQVRATLLEGAQDFETMLYGFAAVASLAESRSG